MRLRFLGAGRAQRVLPRPLGVGVTDEPQEPLVAVIAAVGSHQHEHKHPFPAASSGAGDLPVVAIGAARHTAGALSVIERVYRKPSDEQGTPIEVTARIWRTETALI